MHLPLHTKIRRTIWSHLGGGFSVDLMKKANHVVGHRRTTAESQVVAALASAVAFIMAK